MVHLIVTNPNKNVLEQELPQLVTRGITSIKLYMTYKPLFLRDAELFKIMLAARGLGITTMIHAENNDIIEQITRYVYKMLLALTTPLNCELTMLHSYLGEKGNIDTYFHSVARPQIAESEATYRAISLAEVTDAPILIVHMSAPTALKHLREAQNRLLPIHGEACPHYLYLTSNKLHSKSEEQNYDGAKHICAPPLRHDPKDLEYLWKELANGTFTVVSSDHAPSTFNHPGGKLKAVTRDEHDRTQVDFRNVPNGLPGTETRLPLIFNRTFDPELGPPRDKGVHISLPRFVALTSTNPAQLYGLGDRKGSIQPGFDADIVIWHPDHVPTMDTETNGINNINGAKVINGVSKAGPRFTICNEDLHHRIDYTPFEGMQVRNWPRWVFLRGKKVWEHGEAGIMGVMGDGVFLERKKSRILAGQMGRTASGMKYDEWQYWM